MQIQNGERKSIKTAKVDGCNTNQMTNIDQNFLAYIRANTKRRAKVDEDSEGSMILIRLLLNGFYEQVRPLRIPAGRVLAAT